MQDLPVDIRKLLIEQHLPALEMKTLCLVSKDWKVLIDTTVTALTPRDFTECQPWELVKLSENLQRLELRRDLGMGSMDRMPSFEQLAGLTRLNSLKVHWPRSHLNFPLFQIAGQGLTGLTTLHYVEAQFLLDSDLERLSTLVKLRELSLRGAASIDGTGLAYLNSLTGLQSLDMSCCSELSEEGLEAIAALTQLTALNASCIDLQPKSISYFGANPAEVDIDDHPGVWGISSCLTGLQKLDLRDSVSETQSLLFLLAGLTNLTALDIGLPRPSSRAPMDGCLLLALQKLKTLKADGWHICFPPGAAPSSSSEAPVLGLTELHASTWPPEDDELLLHAALRGGKLRALELNGSSGPVLMCDIPHLWAQATALSRLKFSGCNVQSLSQLRSLPMLKSLSFSRCSISAQSGDVVGISTLETLHFDEFSNLARDVSARNVALAMALRGLHTLKSLRIPGSAELGSWLVGQVAQLTDLQDLDISSQQGADILRPLSALRQLTSLGLAHLGVNNSGLKAIRNLKHLRGLSLDGGRFNDKGLRGLIKLTALRALSLCRCQDITDKGLRAVVVPLSRQSLAWVDVTDCERLTHDASTAGSMGVICCAIHRSFK